MASSSESESPGAAGIGRMLRDINSLAPAVDDAERIDRLRQLEELKSAIAAVQLLEAAAFDTSRRAEQATLGVPRSRQGRGIANEVALALRISPNRSARWLGWAKALTRELPVTFAELRSGRTTEWRAELVARETIWLSREDRAEVDTIVGPQLEHLGDRRVEDETRKHANRLDPAGAAERRRVAERERRVTLRPRPDTMSSLTATNTVERGVEMWARLRRDADALVGTGQAGGRTRDQVMADLHYERVTGREVADGPSVEVELLITSDTLLGTDTDTTSDDSTDNHSDEDAMTDYLSALAAHGDEADRPPVGSSRPGGGGDEPAVLTADGVAPIPIPATIARQLIADAPQAWLRRLFSSPGTGDLVAMESKRREFPAGLKRFLRFRDLYCSTPHCGAPIRHADHAHPAEQGGPTTARNGNGKCAKCNWAKQAPGWTQRMGLGGRGTITTPTGHTYQLRPPRPPGTRRDDFTPVVSWFWHSVEAA